MSLAAVFVIGCVRNPPGYSLTQDPALYPAAVRALRVRCVCVSLGCAMGRIAAGCDVGMLVHAVSVFQC